MYTSMTICVYHESVIECACLSYVVLLQTICMSFSEFTHAFDTALCIRMSD